MVGWTCRVLALLDQDNLETAKTEIRSCGWLAQVDEFGGSIFDFRPHSYGSQDMSTLVDEVLTLFVNGHNAHPEMSSIAA